VRTGNYDEVLLYSGGGKTARTSALPGISGVLAVGQDSPLRKVASGYGRGMLGQKFDLEWLGDFVEAGLVDDPAVWELIRSSPDVPSPPGHAAPTRRINFNSLTTLPFYLTLGIQSAGGAAVILTTLRSMAQDAAPDGLTWGEFEKVDGTTIVQVAAHDFKLFYALTKDRLHIALSVDVLRALLRSGPGRVDTPPGGQFNLDLKPKDKESAFRLALAWLFEAYLFTDGRDNPMAELLLSARPELAEHEEAYRGVSQALLGAVPTTPDGRPYQVKPEGLVDPVRGSAFRPIWPEVPVSGTPLDALIQKFRDGRFEVSVDREPGQETEQSLHTRVRLRWATE
jgi:hypothetical protein